MNRYLAKFLDWFERLVFPAVPLASRVALISFRVESFSLYSEQLARPVSGSAFAGAPNPDMFGAASMHVKAGDLVKLTFRNVHHSPVRMMGAIWLEINTRVCPELEIYTFGNRFIEAGTSETFAVRISRAGFIRSLSVPVLQPSTKKGAT